MKTLHLLCLLITLLIGSMLPAFAIGQDSLYQQPLNGQWAFRTDPYAIGIDSGWYRQERDVSHWEKMPVPGNWDLRNEYAHYAGKAWYRRAFAVPEAWRGENIRLCFESVYYDARIWVNGQEVGENHLGFLPFSFDINSYLHFGEQNSIVVLVDNTFRRGAMWNWGGIRRPVYLEITDKSRLEYQHIGALPDLDRGTAQLELTFEASNIGGQDDQLRVEWEVKRGQQTVWHDRQQNSFRLAANGHVSFHLSTTLPASKVKLWHVNHPELYTSILKLYRGDHLIHQLKSRFGIRKIAVEGEQVKLNGEVIRMVGFNLVADDRTTGNSLPLWRIMEDVDLMKAAGANMARLSHQPLPQAFLDYLDEKGMLIFEEVALWGKDAMVDPNHPVPKEWLSRMIRDQYNHPCIIGWSVGNEIGYTHINPQVMAYVQGAIQQANREDTTRLAVYVSHSADQQKIDPAQYSDMILLNKYDQWGIHADETHENQPGKPIFYSEYGAGITSEDPDLGKIAAHKMLEEMRGKPYLMGASLWTFNDYRSTFTGTPPSENRSWGVVNVFRQKKRAYRDFQREYAPVRKMELQGRETVRLLPREVLDLPAYPLEDYRVLWEAKDQEGHLLDGGFTTVATIHPGDPAVNLPLTWQRPLEQFASIRVSLLDPQGYTVLDTLAYFISPEKPQVQQVLADASTIRVFFPRHPSATSWKVRYSSKAGTRETAETIDNFVEIHGLDQGETYQVQLIALNNHGESVPAAVQTIQTSAKELPPVIWGLSPTDKDCFIAYSVDPKDDVYQVQYGVQSGDNAHFRTVQMNTRGVGRLPGLQKGQTYYLRMRRLTQWGFASEWTPELRFTAGDAAQAPHPIGVLRKGKEALLRFDPAAKAIGYQVQYTDKTTHQTFSQLLNASQIGTVWLTGLEEKHAYDFTIATLMPEGPSAAVPFDKTIVWRGRR